MSELESASATDLTDKEASLLEELNLKKILILTDNGRRHELWEPKSIADVIYYLEREMAEIEDLLKAAYEKKRNIIAYTTKRDVADVTAHEVDRHFKTVPGGGPSDADLRRKQSELQAKLDLIKSQTQAKAA